MGGPAFGFLLLVVRRFPTSDAQVDERALAAPAGELQLGHPRGLQLQRVRGRGVRLACRRGKVKRRAR